ncbi:MAG: hypothetical protein AAF741_13170 [Bacteroidota bacterium]
MFRFESLHAPNHKEDWFILTTSSGNYELRLGGVKPTTVSPTTEKIDFPFGACNIIDIKTDEFACFIELSNGYCIIHSDSVISGAGDISFRVYFWTPAEFEAERMEWYDSCEDLKSVSLSNK